eukprot:3682040-Pleurochrysis_carterae.AAC.1
MPHGLAALLAFLASDFVSLRSRVYALQRYPDEPVATCCGMWPTPSCAATLSPGTTPTAYL